MTGALLHSLAGWSLTLAAQSTGGDYVHRHRLFVDPLHLSWLNLHDHWWLTLLPMAFFISMAYKGVRVNNLGRYWPQVFLMTAQIIVAMIALAAGIFLFVEVLVPLFS